MKLNNPFAVPDADIQDMRCSQSGLITKLALAPYTPPFFYDRANTREWECIEGLKRENRVA